jgi:hypothetical protein
LHDPAIRLNIPDRTSLYFTAPPVATIKNVASLYCSDRRGMNFAEIGAADGQVARICLFVLDFDDFRDW